jgi:signal transduction histidine kinase
MVALESAELFRNLKTNELRALRQVTLEREFMSGQEIFREGDPGDGVYVIKNGQVEISGVVNRGARRVFSQIGPGGLLGEMAVIEHRPRSATATAVKDTTAYFIPRGELLSLIERSPGLAFSVLQVISQRLREFNQHHLREVVQAEQLAVIGRFARSIVHDLKNPLNIISLTTGLACALDSTPEFRAAAKDRVLRQVDRIGELVSEILYFTQSADMTAGLVLMDYHEFVTQFFEELREEARLKSSRLQLAGVPPPLKMQINPKRLRRVFFNLVHNACDAMPDGGDIVLRFSKSPRELITEVEDTGPGVAPEIADKLFQAFATHGKEHGTGLGLSICKKIIEDHGGRIWTRNEPGRGAVFAFALPPPRSR